MLCAFLSAVMAGQLWQSFLDYPGYYNYSPWFPNPVICGRDMAISGYTETVARLPWQGLGVWLDQTIDWARRSVKFDLYSCVLLPLLFAILLTVLRIVLNWLLFKVC